MTINKPSKAGTLESNDIYVMLMPGENGIDIDLESIVEKQFGEDIRRVIIEKLQEMGISSVIVKAQDKGALDYTIKSRIEAAVARGL
ncbi:citrate lyase acyl carrier protein [Ilyobacter polytropus]|uniref:Citrate lyase acyl carrier protein n=1 Tax=Ilyobacter polytropus (strain ATCC 51220 / DSM 2926 / LMG 16218 / CuHBu1) TaxID=572544 RepID=E3H6D2_ILYPC|nr:citrate lyase acyl carrier protein [Ilyobacter polytropus]ADO82345.1 citrate lyase acyl carrier protein [Ilyobacter polytropus DSM 2926]